MWDLDKIIPNLNGVLDRLKDEGDGKFDTKDRDALRGSRIVNATLKTLDENTRGQLTDKEIQALARAGAPERRQG